MSLILSTTTPCCNRNIQFPACASVPTEKYDRRCVRCGIEWTVTRADFPGRPGVRMDKLEWEIDRRYV